MSVVATNNLHIESQLNTKSILSLKINATKGCHASMEATVLTDGGMRDQITGAFSSDRIAVWVTDDYGGIVSCLFTGLVDSLFVSYEGGLEIVTICAVSASTLLDKGKKSRSFQDINLKYLDIINMVLSGTENACVYFHTQDMNIKKPVIQYEETDWQFIKRLASHLGVDIIPGFYEAIPEIHVGLVDGAIAGEIEGQIYRTVFDPRYYTDGEYLGMQRADFVYYDVDSFEIYNIGDRVLFLEQVLHVCESKFTMTNGVLYCVYRLATPDYYMSKQQYNNDIRGISLPGVVLETNHELVRIHLDIDEHQDPSNAYDYTWRPETGNLMYLMPEPGTRVTLFMQSSDEFSAICRNCDRTNGEQLSEAQRPEDRYLTTPYKKRMFWKPDEAGFISINESSYVKIDDAIGTITNSSGRLLIQAEDELTFDGKEVIFSAPKEITIVRRKPGSPTVLNICYNFDIIGNVGGFSTNQPPEKAKDMMPFGKVEGFDIDDIADTIIAAVPIAVPPAVPPAVPAAFVSHTDNSADGAEVMYTAEEENDAESKNVSTTLSSALQGTFVAHLAK